MNKKNIKKPRRSVVVFLALIILSLGLIIFARDVKADAPSVSVYYLVTSDTTPLIKGTVSEADADVSLVIPGYVDETVTAIGGSWSYQLTAEEALTSGVTYAVGVASIIDEITYVDSAFIYVDEEYPLELYFESDDEESFITLSVTFLDEYTYTSEEDHFSLTFPAGTEITKTGGGTFNLVEWYAEGVDPNNERIILKLRFGVPDIDLTFSNDVTITFDVGEEYNGQTLNIFSRGDGSNDEGWEPLEVSCTVTGGSCSFDVSHASYFAISQYTSIAETEEGENDDEDDNQEAYISSWKAYQYTTDSACSDKLKVIIKGRHFDKDAEVKIGDKKAFSVDRKSSQEIVAKFCLKKLLNVKTKLKRIVSVTNPDTEKEKADKKINLADIKYKYNENDFDPQTAEGTKNIQQALFQLGFLDGQYITGFYGPLTTNAVMEFQKQNGISQTGYVGPLTKAKLEEKMK